MSEKMEIAEQPQITILMAIYEPRMDWLREQLDSLEAQTYPNIRLCIRDDCSPTVPHEDICACVAGSIRSFPYSIQRNEQNLGSNKTFERLTSEADGDYFAYCDQDDIWLPEKLEALFSLLRRTDGAAMAYCGQSVIDEASRVVSEDIREFRPGDEFPTGKGLAEKLFVKNSIYGCTTLFSAEAVRTALPLPEGIQYDHWFSLWASEQGGIVREPATLLRYRLHTGNQSTPFRDTHTKRAYCAQRIMVLRRRAASCEARFSDAPETVAYIREVGAWAQARERWFHGDLRALPGLWKGRRFSKKAAYFELFLPLCPTGVFRRLIHRLR